MIRKSANLGDAYPLFRAEVKKAMQAKGAGLVVLMSDCCSERLKASDATHRPALPPPVHFPAVRCLFFQHRGVVDITAAEDNTCAWGDERGGVFTRAFCEAMKPDQFQKFADRQVLCQSVAPAAQHGRRPHQVVDARLKFGLREAVVCLPGLAAARGGGGGQPGVQRRAARRGSAVFSIMHHPSFRGDRGRPVCDNTAARCAGRTRRRVAGERPWRESF